MHIDIDLISFGACRFRSLTSSHPLSSFVTLGGESLNRTARMAFVPCGVPSVLSARSQWTGGCVCGHSLSWTASRRLQAATLLPPRTAGGGAAPSAVRMELGVGSDLPVFSLPTNGGGTLSSDAVSTGLTILYFYPRDATPGCTTEAKDFRDMMGTLVEMGVSVVGVSKDSVESHDKFVAKYSLPFPLVSDDGTLSEAFGVWKVCMRVLDTLEFARVCGAGFSNRARCFDMHERGRCASWDPCR